MSVVFPSLMKTPLWGVLMIVFLVWSLHTLDAGSMRETIIRSETYSLRGGKTKNISLETVEMNPNRPLILYAYSEEATARENFKFFLRHGLHGAADFVFIINGESDIVDSIPKEPNFRVVQRPNECYDIGAHSEVLQKDNLYKKYKRFILLNASIRGPFSPQWANGCWSDMYLERLSTEVKLVGMTANCGPSFHVQSMILATDKVGMETLLHPTQEALTIYKANPPKEAFPLEFDLDQTPGINGCFKSYGHAVKAEISITSLIRAAGYKYDVMMSAFKGTADYEHTCDPNVGDLLWDRRYYGINVHPFETIFIKSNRDIDPLVVQRHTEWAAGRGYTSYDHCKGD
ncbi:hypothetical protein HYFRA_00006130 [Hymenoscyphus fraxineus]|uniref:Uncharacterized protein n=1 Tax=Hymenoscyphus fraxineus TaxID=746836 RepID=A0A9N9PZM8_9HELO|nr:hypothetical protein HYFRA_00006130 [Hymenoscyphus fraxineus]